MIIVKVVFPFPIRQCFKYIMPDSMSPVIGGRVIAPFRSRNIVGIVISFCKKINVNVLDFKSVKSLIDFESLYTDILLDILIWISRYYYCPIGNIFFSVLPKYLRDGYIPQKEYFQKWTITKKGKEININILKRAQKQFDTLLFLKKRSILLSELKIYNLSPYILKKLETKRLCSISFVRKTSVLKEKYLQMNKKVFLSKNILYTIKNIIKQKQYSSFLLTKTYLYAKVKFYLGLINELLKKSMQILILVSCMKDINKISCFLKKYFNVIIDVVHQKLTDSLYLKIWMKTKNGNNSIIIGTKKSIFLPFVKLGLIIVDQEHSLNYKIIGRYRYNIRDIGIFRAYKENIPIILDSNSPSLKTLYNVLHKKCSNIILHSCENIIKFKNKIIDLKKEKIKIGLSETLIKEICDNVKKKQVLLICNQFYLSFFILMCNICKWTFKCSVCNDYYQVNLHKNILFCKFCLIKVKKPLFCHYCKSLSLVIFNMSIEEIKNKIQKIFYNVPIFFLLDKKNINKNILNMKSFSFSITYSCIIFSTEKIVKNYFFPSVKLIGLISIDHYFHSFNFSSIEHFAQFYINLNKLIKNTVTSLKILIQTSFSDNSSLTELCKNGYFQLINKELIIRKKFLLPPWNCYSIFYVESTNPEKNFNFLNCICNIINKKSKKYNINVHCFNPVPTVLLHNKKKYFHQLLIKCSSRFHLNYVINETINTIIFFPISKNINWFMDIEPY